MKAPTTPLEALYQLRETIGSKIAVLENKSTFSRRTQAALKTWESALNMVEEKINQLEERKTL